MPKKSSSRVKDRDQYETLRDKGMSKNKAARIANTDRSTAGRRGGRSPKYEEWTRDDLYEKAKDVGVEGRSNMNKKELINALRSGKNR